MSQHLESRITALERSNRQLRVALGVLLLVVITLSTVAASSKPAALEMLRVRSLDVVNDDGVTVIHLGVRSSGAGGFWLTNAEGNRVLHLNQTEQGGGRIAVSTAAGIEAAQLSAALR